MKNSLPPDMVRWPSLTTPAIRFVSDGLIPNGTAQIMTQLSSHSLVFFSDENFSVEACIAHYGSHALNYAGAIIDHTALSGLTEGEWFVRPISARKSSTGASITSASCRLS